MIDDGAKISTKRGRRLRFGPNLPVRHPSLSGSDPNLSVFIIILYEEKSRPLDLQIYLDGKVEWDPHFVVF